MYSSPDSRSAARAGLAVGVATAAYGVSFGALSTAAGLDVWQTCFLSLVMFTGGSQFALIGVLASGGLAAAPSAIAGAALLGSRNVIYALRMSPVVGSGWFTRTLAAHLTIDESVAVAVAQPTLAAQRAGFWVTGLVVFVGWNITTLVGALIGNLIGDVSAYGLDAAAAAAFLGLLWPRLKARQAQAVAVGAAVAATLLTPVLAPGLPVIVAALVAVLFGLTNWLGPRQGPQTAEITPIEGMPS
ncbi:AzlC family ABC transporter permease [Subtercola sp. PAMC28395]|uniref:AzlC family ABC transporter permease n=1 Tax=Subtercola sp. PAMC28395 TaxID=2846775 RepID=UPI001C0CA369|nr:AzlC family ABC transporter permease [Subtercola sp. PAMC28395]QWT23465.1 AzlC family ABC transporter permease [Subtercola sp. PAMC28395]